MSYREEYQNSKQFRLRAYLIPLVGVGVFSVVPNCALKVGKISMNTSDVLTYFAIYFAWHLL